MITTKKSKLAAAAVASSLLLGGGTAAFASTTASTPAGGTVHIFVNVNVTNQTVQPVVFTGVIGDYGTTISMTKSGKVDANGNYAKVVLKKGTFKINVTKVNANAMKHQSLDAATCSFAASGTGASPLFAGTGLYKGISGSLTVTAAFGGVAPRTSGGSCNFDAQPLKAIGEVSGVGKVKF